MRCHGFPVRTQVVAKSSRKFRYLPHLERAICEDADFARQFEAMLPKLKTAGKKFVEDMVSLCAESEWMPLTHGDVQDINGSHVYNIQNIRISLVSVFEICTVLHRSYRMLFA